MINEFHDFSSNAPWRVMEKKRAQCFGGVDESSDGVVDTCDKLSDAHARDDCFNGMIALTKLFGMNDLWQLSLGFVRRSDW